MSEEGNVEQAVYEAMALDEAYAEYKKTIRGKVVVSYLNSFTGKPEQKLLSGEDNNNENARHKVWSKTEDLYFKRANRKHFEFGRVVEVSSKATKAKAEKRAIEQYSDEELKEVIKSRYVTFQKLLAEVASPAVVYRMHELAKDMDVSDKVMSSIKLKLSELQLEVEE